MRPRRNFITMAALLTTFLAAALSVFSAAGGAEAAYLSQSSTRAAQEQITTGSDGIRRITLEAARKAIEKGTAVIVDVRSAEAYKAGHVTGALWIPVGDISMHTKQLPRSKMIITYCS